MRANIATGAVFPDYQLTDHTGIQTQYRIKSKEGVQWLTW